MKNNRKFICTNANPENLFILYRSEFSMLYQKSILTALIKRGVITKEQAEKCCKNLEKGKAKV